MSFDTGYREVLAKSAFATGLTMRLVGMMPPAKVLQVVRSRGFVQVCGSRIGLRHAQARKVAGPPGRRRHGNRTAAAGALNDALIIDKEEELVLPNRAAQRSAEDVLAKL